MTVREFRLEVRGDNSFATQTNEITHASRRNHLRKQPELDSPRAGASRQSSGVILRVTRNTDVVHLMFTWTIMQIVGVSNLGED
jgi:hypothetical protein